MTSAQAEARHAELAAEIRRHDHAYYVLAQPLVSNHEYDRLYRELVDLEKEFPDLATPESPTEQAARKKSEALTKEIKRLRLEIEHHDRLYYAEAKPEISDLEYDRLVKRLKELEHRRHTKKPVHRRVPELPLVDSPTERVSGAPSGKFARVKHLQPMLSLEKVEAAEQPDEKAVPDWFQRSCQQDENTLPRLLEFDATICKHLVRDLVEYVMEPKVDGVSIGVHYRHGKLALGVTRGDGQFGDDITTNLRTVRSIPLELNLKNPPALLEVRGEAYMPIKEFEALNKKLEAAGEKSFPNARNATAGALKQLDPQLVAQRPIRAVFYAVGACEGIEFATHAKMLEALKEFGLPTQTRWWLCRDMEEVLGIYRKDVVCRYDEDRDLRRQLSYEIDGVVIKMNRIADWAQIPAKTRAPGYAIVHKPVPWITPAETVLKAITVQVGRTGVLTPVAELEPVFVQGSTISRATLHNEDEIRRKDIRIGDTVVIRKAGMVIPEVVEVMKTKRPAGAKEFDLFQHIGGKCPACGGAIAKDKVSAGDQEEVAWRCQNVSGCPAQKTRLVEYFAQRKALDIESLGGIVAERLVESGLVKEPLDLFDLSVEKLARLNLGTADEPRVFGAKNAAKVKEALERARTLPLHRWLHALAIPEVGEQTAWQLSQVHSSVNDLASSQVLRDIRDLGDRKAERDMISPKSRKNPPKNDAELATRKMRYELLGEEIAEIEARLAVSGTKTSLAEVGPVASTAVLDFFGSAGGKRVLARLHQLGIKPAGTTTATGIPASSEKPLSGKMLVLTGTLPTLSRDQASKLIREAGGNVTSSVSKNTDYVVAGEEAGSKLTKAQQLGVKVIDEATLRKFCGG